MIRVMRLKFRVISILPTPVFTGNIDSLCWEMEKRFVDTLNEWRVNHGLNEITI